MERTYKTTEINVGFHPDGYRVDKTAPPMNLYTRWKISHDGKWHSPEPVDFDVLPQDGWLKAEGFDWNQEL